MEYFINIANVLYLLSYFVRDILWLRILTVVAASCLIPYFYFRAAPIMPVIYWNTFFIVLNVCWIVRLVSERKGHQAADEGRDAISVSNLFCGLTYRLCRSVMSRASIVRP